MEGDIDTSKRDCSETTLEDNIALSLLFLEHAVLRSNGLNGATCTI